MKIIAVMPIKLANERLPGKNTKLLGHKPLLQYALDSLKQTNMLDDIYVFCSDSSIVNFLPDGVRFVKRPEYLDLPSSNFSQIFDCFMPNCKSAFFQPHIISLKPGAERSGLSLFWR